MEEFKKINEYENYMISNLGNVYSIKNDLILKPFLDGKKRYLQVSLCKDGTNKKFLIHRLVAEYFVENPFNKEEVNHINYISTDNNYKNLEWCTRQENMKHCFLKHSQVRNFRECALYYKDFFMGNFKSIKAACRYASDMFGLSFSMLDKHREYKGFKIIATETQSTIPFGSTSDNKLLMEAPIPKH